MKRSHVATMLALGVLLLGVVVYGNGPTQDIPQREFEIRVATGRLTLLRVKESGVHHVTAKLQSEPKKAFTFALGGSSKEAMFDLLREAFVGNMIVEISSVRYPDSSTNTITQVALKR